MDKKEMEKENEFRFTIRTLEDDKLIGECFLEPNWNHQSSWLAIGIGEPDYRSKGYGTDAMRVLCLCLPRTRTASDHPQRFQRQSARYTLL